MPWTWSLNRRGERLRRTTTVRIGKHAQPAAIRSAERLGSLPLQSNLFAGLKELSNGWRFSILDFRSEPKLKREDRVDLGRKIPKIISKIGLLDRAIPCFPPGQFDTAGCDYRRVSTAIPYLQTLGGFLVERAG